MHAAHAATQSTLGHAVAAVGARVHDRVTGDRVNAFDAVDFFAERRDGCGDAVEVGVRSWRKFREKVSRACVGALAVVGDNHPVVLVERILEKDHLPAAFIT